MTDAAGRHRLQEIFRRESRSFLQYIHQTTAWSNLHDKPLVAKMHQFAAEELSALEAFAEWLDTQRIALPYLGAFSTAFTSFNFIGIRTLLRELIPRQRMELDQLEQDAAVLSNSAQTMVNRLGDLKRKHLAELPALGA